MALEEGEKAPQFKAVNQNGEIKKLSDYYGGWLVLYFYPKDFTPGCTIEACNFRDDHAQLKELATVVGVSQDSVDRHKKFEEKFNLPFELLSDHGGKIANTYGADGKIFKKRITFLIDPKGIIQKFYKSVKPSEHTQQVLDDLKRLV
ncbi:MAG: peroxiredoxin [bacterium]|nr:peroxiredoxin [bacterium]